MRRRAAVRRRGGRLRGLWLHLLGLRGTLLDMVPAGLDFCLLTAKRRSVLFRRGLPPRACA